MKNKRFLFAALSAALVCGVFFTACPNGTTATPAEPDAWSALTDFNQLNGKWYGTYTANEKIGNFVNYIPDNVDIGQFAGQINTFSGVNVKAFIEITMTINTALKTRETTAKITATFSGDKNQVAALMVLLSMAAASPDAGGALTIVSTNSVRITTPPETSEITGEEIATMMSTLQINQNGKKIKIPARLDDPQAGTPATPEIVFVKIL